MEKNNEGNKIMATTKNLLKALITSLILTVPFLISTKMFNYFIILFIVIFIASFTSGQVVDKIYEWKENARRNN